MPEHLKSTVARFGGGMAWTAGPIPLAQLTFLAVTAVCALTATPVGACIADPTTTSDRASLDAAPDVIVARVDAVYARQDAGGVTGHATATPVRVVRGRGPPGPFSFTFNRRSGGGGACPSGDPLPVEGAEVVVWALDGRVRFAPAPRVPLPPQSPVG